MDERAIKRLVLILVVSIIVIMLAKFMLTKTFTSLNKAAVAKKPAVVIQQPAAPAAVVEVAEPLAASAVMDTSVAASSVESIAR